MVTRAGPVATATAKSIRAAQIGDQDAAAVALAKHYAALVDGGDQAAGLRLLKVLDSLGLTPGGRAARPPAAGGEPDATPATNPTLDRLRAQHGPGARQHRTAALHAVPD